MSVLMKWTAGACSRMGCYIPLLLSICLVVVAATTYNLQGGHDSYMAFNYWRICSPTKLTFNFKTHLPDGLIMYQDDGGGDSFLELKLSAGELAMRLKFTKHKYLNFRIGEKLADRSWHTVTIERSGADTVLILDSAYRSSSNTGMKRDTFGSGPERSLLFVGGIPQLHVLKFDSITLPSAFYEPRFSGSIKDLRLRNCSASLQDIAPVSYNGLLPSESDHCRDPNLCHNNGRCLSSSDGFECDCQYSFFEGPTCSKERDDLIATFTGSEFLHYNLTEHGRPIESSNDSIHFSFKSTTGDGLLFYTGDSKQYLNVGLFEGIIYLAMDLGDGEEVDRVGTGRQFDDGYWHELVIRREAKELTRKRGVCTVFINIDGMYEASRSFAGSFSNLISGALFVGGAHSLKDLQGTRATQNFRGCLKEVKFKAGSTRLIMLRLAKSRSPLITQQGELSIGPICKPVPQDESVSILESQDSLILPAFGTSKTNFMALTFRTTVKEGLLVYAEEKGKSMIAVELFKGHLYVIIDHTGVTKREKIGIARADDGTEQQLHMTLTNWGAIVEFNDVLQRVSVGDQLTPSLRLTSPVSLAGIDDSTNEMDLHPAVYTAGLRSGFVGCLKDVKIDGVYQDLKQLSRDQGIRISSSCNQSAPSCSLHKCKHEGACMEGWQRASCDCSLTAYTGSHCTEESATMRFNGDQHFTISPPVKLSTIADDVTVQFRTRHSHGALLNSRSKDRRSGLDMFLYLGKLYIQITLVGTEHLLLAGESLNDHQWHSLTFTRIGAKVKVIVDSETVIDQELPIAPQDKALTIDMDEINLAQPIDPAGMLTRSRDDANPTSKASFIGHMRQLLFNNKPYLQLASEGNDQFVTYTGDFSTDPVAPNNPVSFASINTYVAQNMPSISALTTFYLQIRTREANGLILLRGGRSGHFFALELVQGSLNYIYSLKNRVEVVSSSSRSRLDNNQWHDVMLIKLANGSQSLVVDNLTYTSTSGVKEDFQLDGPLYIAGVPKDKYTKLPTSLQVTIGYKGCIASLDVNGRRLDLTEGRGNRDKLVKGCTDSAACAADSCQNSGICVQSWPTLTCSCDMTSFSGPTCAEEGTTYYFGGATGGLVMYTFPYPAPDTSEDNLAFGFITSMNTRATMVKQTSSNSADFIEVRIEGGKVRAIYNIGTDTHTIAHTDTVNDGEYHVLKFTRRGSNSSLQIDNRTVRSHPKAPKLSSIERRTPNFGTELSVFNSQSLMTVGGHSSRTQTVGDPFTGYISGVNINGISVLELAEANHPSITIQGDARLTDSIGKSTNHGMLQDREQAIGDNTGANTGEILLPNTNSPCMSGLNPDICNEDPGLGEIIDRKIVVSSIAPATVTRRPVNTWPEDNYKETSRRRRYTTKAVTAIATESREGTAYHPRGELEQSTHGPFDLERNLPLIAGICGAALVTVILIAVIIYRLTRKENHNYSTPQHRPSYSIDEDLKNDINGQRTNGSTPNMALNSNALSHRSGSKEWYV